MIGGCLAPQACTGTGGDGALPLGKLICILSLLAGLQLELKEICVSYGEVLCTFDEIMCDRSLPC